MGTTRYYFGLPTKHQVTVGRKRLKNATLRTWYKVTKNVRGNKLRKNPIYDKEVSSKKIENAFCTRAAKFRQDYIKYFPTVLHAERGGKQFFTFSAKKGFFLSSLSGEIRGEKLPLPAEKFGNAENH